jgi:hypothetical protein
MVVPNTNNLISYERAADGTAGVRHHNTRNDARQAYEERRTPQSAFRSLLGRLCRRRVAFSARNPNSVL